MTLHEVIARYPAVIGKIMMIGEFRNVKIGNGDHVKMIRFELGDHSSQVGKHAAIYSKGAVLFLVVEASGL